MIMWVWYPVVRKLGDLWFCADWDSLLWQFFPVSFPLTVEGTGRSSKSLSLDVDKYKGLCSFLKARLCTLTRISGIQSTFTYILYSASFRRSGGIWIKLIDLSVIFFALFPLDPITCCVCGVLFKRVLRPAHSSSCNLVIFHLVVSLLPSTPHIYILFSTLPNTTQEFGKPPWNYFVPYFLLYCCVFRL